MLASAAVGWGAFALSLSLPLGSVVSVLALVVAIFSLLRAVLFVHELTHLRRGALPFFEISWNALVGLPLGIPSLMYVGSHGSHHGRTSFATATDPEYAPIANWSRLHIVLFVLGVALVPLVLPLRWGVLGPLSYLFPPLRRRVVSQASTLVINTDYRRPMPRGEHVTRWAAQEAAAAVLVWLAALAVWTGVLSLAFVVSWVVLLGGILVVNQVRTLAAHRYEHEGEPVDADAQLMDSVNLCDVAPWTKLVAPVGLRYHALHHLLPSVPYHGLGTLHRQLAAELSEDAPYRRTEERGIAPVLHTLWRKAAAWPLAGRGRSLSGSARSLSVARSPAIRRSADGGAGVRSAQSPRHCGARASRWRRAASHRR
jgi:fatty acid desaturase